MESIYKIRPDAFFRAHFGAVGGEILTVGGAKVGFMPQPIGYVPPNWLLSGSALASSKSSILMQLPVASWGAYTPGTRKDIEGHAFLGVSRTPVAL